MNHIQLGLRWLTGGWRLFRRNPWLLGAMGFFGAAFSSALALIPFLGGPLAAMLAPVFLASAYLAIETLAGQKLQLPRTLRFAAIKQAPRELLSVCRDEERLILTTALALYGLTVGVLANTVVLVVAGSAWSYAFITYDVVAIVRVIVAALLVSALYLAFAASAIFTLPLVYLREQPLFPAMLQSLKASARYAPAILVVAACALGPLMLGGIVYGFSVPAAYTVGFVSAAVALPVAAAGLYCGYRTVFPKRPEVQRVKRRNP